MMAKSFTVEGTITRGAGISCNEVIGRETEKPTGIELEELRAN
jgi:hypothetical protein